MAKTLPGQCHNTDPMTLMIPAIPSMNGKRSTPGFVQMALWFPGSLRDVFSLATKKQDSDMSTTILQLCLEWLEQYSPKLLDDWLQSETPEQLTQWLGEEYYRHLLQRRALDID